MSRRPLVRCKLLAKLEGMTGEAHEPEPRQAKRRGEAAWAAEGMNDGR